MSLRTRIIVTVTIAVVLAGLAHGLSRVDAELSTPRDLHGAPHATSGECQRCHPSQFESWRRTFHRTMTQDASESSVLGDFASGEPFEYGGITALPTRADDGAFEVRFTGPEGLIAQATIERTVGSRRVQQYLAREGDVLFRLPIAWHVEEGRWMHMNGAFLTPDPDGIDTSIEVADYYRHVTRWNDNCVFCHNVAANPGWVPEGERYETEVAELGIACEACHGPADEHAAINANPLRRYALHLSEREDPTIVNPARLSSDSSAQVCGRCHGQRITSDVSRFLRDGDPYVPGENLSDYSRPLARDTPLEGDPTAFASRFWPDGTARLTAYEYQGLLQSPCDELTCIDCHGMHEGDPRGQVRPSREGDDACLSCHARDDHSNHRATRCVDCHMPRVVYGIIGVHRSHRIEVPDPWNLARPDACALCHADRTSGWVQAGYARFWDGPERREPTPYPRAHHDAVAGDPIERAVALAALGRTEGLREGRRRERVRVLLDAMTDDPYPALRHIASRSLISLEGLGEDYTPTDGPSARGRWVYEASAQLATSPLDPELAARWRGEAAEVAISIGE